MVLLCSLILSLVVCVAGEINIVTEKEYNNFPRLFHLDDYERCLAQEDGLYCVGTFHLTAREGPNHLYDLIKKYSSHRTAFNRTLLHRGYCVNIRCPTSELNLQTERSLLSDDEESLLIENMKENELRSDYASLRSNYASLSSNYASLRSHNDTERFEKCINKYLYSKSLSAKLQPSYCVTPKSRHEMYTRKPDFPQTIFLYLVYLIIVLNIVGTVCEIKFGNMNKILTCWSIRSNWVSFTTVSEVTDPRLKKLSPLHGIRTLAVIIVIGGHCAYGRYLNYGYHPNYLEEYPDTILGEALTNGRSFLHVFIMLTSFLTSYFLLTWSEKQKLGLKFLPLCILKRVLRTSPIHLFFVGYAATWWVYLRDGPLWLELIGSQNDLCRNKFWYHVFLVNNDSTHNCFLTTWYFAAEMHIYILSCLLTLTLGRFARKAIPIYAVLFVLSCAMTSIISYVNGWKGLLHTASAENFRIFYRDDPAFYHLELSSWALLPPCFLGLFFGHFIYESQKNGYKFTNDTWIKFWLDIFFPVMFVWMLIAYVFREWDSSLAAALHIGFQRPGYCLLMGFTFCGVALSDIENHWFRRFLSHKSFQILGRLSVALMPIHWMIIATLAASRQHAVSTVWMNMVEDWIVVVVTSHILAVPALLLVEMPVQKTVGALFFNDNKEEKIKKQS